MSHRDAVEKFEVEGLQVRIERDEDASNPREDDNFGHMVCFHRRYDLGDKHEFADGDALREFLEDKANDVAVTLPLYLYDHSGITMNTSGFSCPWDSGQVGVIYCTNADIRENWGVK